MAPTICPTCSCTEIDIVDVSGEAVCVSCGTIVEENNIVSSIEFHESGGGAHSVVGQFVSASATKSYGNVGTSGRNYGMESRANTLANGKKKIRQIAGMLRLGDHYVDSAFRLYALALQRNFTHGRKASTVIAACLYIVCRRERSPHLLIDFSDKLQLNVYVLGGVFLKFCKLLQIHLPLIDPSLYIHRFASQLNFGAKTHSIATTALRLVATMKRDWIETGRRPSGICGAALLIAARSQSVMCSLHDVMDIVNIGERTLKQRLYEFSLTPTAQLTYDQVGRLEMSRVECDPPSFQRHREKEVMEMLLIESERLPLENGSRKRGRRQEEEDVLDGSAVRKLKQLKDEDMSRFLGWESTHKKRPSGLLSGGGASSGSTNGASSAVTDDAGAGSGNGAAAAAEEDVDEDEDDDDEIDYGFENANDQIVNRASRLAAQEVLTRVRRKSVRYIMRKREEADFYKTIERDLTLALEEENRAASSATSNGNDAATATDSLSPEVAVPNGKPTHKEDARVRRKTSDDMSYASRQLRRRQGRRRDADGEDEEDYDEDEHDDDGDGDYDDDERDNAPDEEVVEEEDEEEQEEEEDERSADRRLVVAKAGHRSSGDRSRDDANTKEGDSMSDLDDDEINSLLLTKEEADKKRILWEKMNADYIKEQVRHGSTK
jgi:transcription initiation factor TFIIIB Brf1 subunit/transcription initiation factor TFIIB